MRIRCGACHGSIWIQTVDVTPGQDVAICDECSQQYELHSKLKDVDLYDFQRDAHDFARNAGVDLPAAYSILLGITTLDKVQDMLEQSSGSGKASFDRSFSDAVEAGHLTPQQATMRGKREVVAEQLVERHQIAMEQALEVADNKIPLLEAVRQGGRFKLVEYEPVRRRFPWGRVFSTIAAMLAVSGAAAVVIISQYPDVTVEPVRKQQGVPKPTRVIASLEEATAEVLYDDQGLTTEVAGGNPKAVLDAFCRSVKGFKAEPVTLQAAGEDWNGLYRRRGVLYSLPIHWNRSRGLWVAGNAEDWVQGKPIPPSR
jgi:hypothetical protein